MKNKTWLPLLQLLIFAMLVGNADAQSVTRLTDQTPSGFTPLPSEPPQVSGFPVQEIGPSFTQQTPAQFEQAITESAQLGSFPVQEFEPSPIQQTQVEPEEEASFPNFKVTGFFHLDGAYFSQDELNLQTLGDIEDGLGFRRARIAAAGNVTEDVSYILEFDFAQSQARFVDVWFQKSDTRLGNIRIGRFRQPFGMSEVTSVRELPFLERPLTFALSPFRQTGISLFDQTRDERGTWAVAGYRYLSDNFGNVFGDNGGYGLTTRLTRVIAEAGPNRLVHLGVDYSLNDAGRDTVQFVSTNEVFLSQNPNLGPPGLSVLPLVGVTPFVNTGPLSVDTVHFFSAEAAIGAGPWAIQSEARWARVEQADGEVLDFPGAYAQVRWVLTGEDVPYSKSAATFTRIVPNSDFNRNGGIGAWELLGRISHLDLNDGTVNGRRLTDFTVGLNWYWNRYTKLQFNWINSQLNDDDLGDSVANAFAFRAQIDF